MEPLSDDGAFLRDAGATLGIALTEAQIQQFLTFRALLLVANEQMNLTAITEPHAVLARHFVDALTCVVGGDVALRETSTRVLDVGSGAGLPGLALAIALPQWQIVSLEATGKKVRFQASVIAALGLTNATAVQGRAEDLARIDGWRGGFGVVTARALAALPTLLEWCQPFAVVGGLTLALKKGDLGEELSQGSRAARLLGGAAPEVLPLPAALTARVPDLADGRVVVRVRQLQPCDARYPRPGAASMKSPLGAD